LWLSTCKGAIEVLRVLVADDDPTIRTLVRYLLADIGIDVIEAGDGDDVLALALAEDPDVAVIDWRMPHGGLSLVRKLVDDYAFGERLIMLSGIDDPRDQRAALEAGAARYFVKPAPGAAIVQAVLKCGRHRLRRVAV
jgi:DNA-binding response OmpR family regulator